MNIDVKIVGDKEVQLYLNRMAKGIKNDSKKALNDIAKHLQKEARDKLGHYYKSWPKLKRASVIAKYRRRALRGHSMGKRKTTSFRIGPDNPLVLFGELKKSILKEINGASMEAVVYTDNEYSAVHEYGYKQVPARSYMRSTLHDEEDKLADMVNNRISKNI
jgi:phage gpG-like protein